MPAGLPLRKALEETGIGVVACDHDGHISLVSPALRELLGLDADADADDEVWEQPMWHPDGTVAPRSETPLDRARAGAWVRDAVVGIETLRGEVYWLRCNGGPVLDGSPFGAWLLTQDVTAQRRAAAVEDDLRSRLQTTVDQQFRAPLAALLDTVAGLVDPETSDDLSRSLRAITASTRRLEDLVSEVSELIDRQERLHRSGRTPDGAPRRVV